MRKLTAWLSKKVGRQSKLWHGSSAFMRGVSGKVLGPANSRRRKILKFIGMSAGTGAVVYATQTALRSVFSGGDNELDNFGSDNDGNANTALTGSRLSGLLAHRRSTLFKAIELMANSMKEVVDMCDSPESLDLNNTDSEIIAKLSLVNSLYIRIVSDLQDPETATAGILDLDRRSSLAKFGLEFDPAAAGSIGMDLKEEVLSEDTLEDIEDDASSALAALSSYPGKAIQPLNSRS